MRFKEVASPHYTTAEAQKEFGPWSLQFPSSVSLSRVLMFLLFVKSTLSELQSM
jgi:hypothetical protein